MFTEVVCSRIFFSCLLAQLGSTPDLAAESCKAIASSVEEIFVSGEYWLNITDYGIVQVTFQFR